MIDLYLKMLTTSEMFFWGLTKLARIKKYSLIWRISISQFLFYSTTFEMIYVLNGNILKNLRWIKSSFNIILSKILFTRSVFVFFGGLRNWPSYKKKLNLNNKYTPILVLLQTTFEIIYMLNNNIFFFFNTLNNIIV